MTDEEKQVHINKFIDDYQSKRVNFLEDERKNLFKLWVDLYTATFPDAVKNRVKQIK